MRVHLVHATHVIVVDRADDPASGDQALAWSERGEAVATNCGR